MLRPLNALVLCKVLPADTMSSGGIVIPSTVRGRPNRAEVVRTGHGRRLEKLAGESRVMPYVHVGETVIFDAYKIHHVVGGDNVATPVANPGDLFLIHEDDLLAVIED